MWYLTSDSDPRIIYVISSEKDVTIGRSIEAQNCDFGISDQSISRRHATLSISNNCLILQDLGSRYGTYINDSSDKMEANAKVQIKAGHIIKFGKFSCIWKAHEVNFVTCTSTLKGENLISLKSCLGKLGGTLKNDWDDTCAYLTMPGITLTIKVVLALVQGSSIVTTEFWQKCVEAVNSSSMLPGASEFTPQVIESTLNKELVSFLPNENRKALFKGKKFIFFTRRQLDMYKTVLIKSSASALLLSESKLTKSMLCEKDVIMIQYNIAVTSQETQAQRDQINEIVNYLKNNNKRLVADAEIGLAILYCSIDKYCNPSFNFPSEIIKQMSGGGGASAETNILAPESQEPTNIKKENIVINESLTSREELAMSNNVSSKRKLVDDNDISNASKKLATRTSTNNNITYDGSKRKFAEESSTHPMNPPKRMAVGTESDNNDEDFFDFVDNKSSDTGDNKNNASKTLNFKQLLHNKKDLAVNDADDELFNFIEEKPRANTAQIKNNVFNNAPGQSCSGRKPSAPADQVDITLLRGIKLKELMESNLNPNNFPKIKTIKTEVTDDLGESLSNLDLGTTIIKVRPNLIVKKEVLEPGALSAEVKNFKRFKKVWPVRMHVTAVPQSTTSIVEPDGKMAVATPSAV